MTGCEIIHAIANAARFSKHYWEGRRGHHSGVILICDSHSMGLAGREIADVFIDEARMMDRMRDVAEKAAIEIQDLAKEVSYEKWLKLQRSKPVPFVHQARQIVKPYIKHLIFNRKIIR